MKGNSRIQIESGTRLNGSALTTARVIAVALLLLYVGLFISGIPAGFARAHLLSTPTRLGLGRLGLSADFTSTYFIVLDTCTMLALGLISAFIFWRRSDDWMVMLIAVTLVATGMIYTVPGYEAPVPAIVIALAVSLGEICQLMFVYLFPNGRFVPRWLWVLLVPLIVWRPIMWGLIYLPNFLASARTGENYGTLQQSTLDIGLMVVLFIIGIVAQIYRYRRISTPTQRQQTKWLLVGVIGAIAVLGAYVITVNTLGLLDRSGPTALFVRMAGRTVRQFALLLLPITIAVSILRYRLFDIDLVIRRTLVYGVLTAMLALLFFGGVTLLQQLFVRLTGQRSDIALVASTLLIAALALPLRNRIQTAIDRRFYRKKYDAQKTLEAFATRLQSQGETDVEGLAAEVTGVIQETLQPSHVKVWLVENPPAYARE